MAKSRDHGGGLDAAIARWGGRREDWLDLSTGINPVPFPIGQIPSDAWNALPDTQAQNRLLEAARRFWNVPSEAAILAAPGASSLIAQMPSLFRESSVGIVTPTYNEHAAAFASAGWQVAQEGDLQVIVHPNNPDGRIWQDVQAPCIIDESFCDVMPEASMVARAAEPGVVVLKSFGKFWGLAGVRLGFAIAQPDLIETLTERLGPWAVSGPALEIGANALENTVWARETRQRLSADAAKLDAMVGAKLVGGTDLFRLYEVNDAATWQEGLAKEQVWSRIFPYSNRWLRLGLPAPDRWGQLKTALAGLR